MRLRARWASIALLLLVPLTAAPSADAAAGLRQSPLPVARSSQAIPGEYIVSLKPAFAPSAVLDQLGARAFFTYRTALLGFAARLSPEQLAVVRTLPAVKAVEENATVTVDPEAADLPAAGPGAARPAGRAIPAATWGLDRIDQRQLPLDGQYNALGTGVGVTAYIVDTGIETGHSEFGGRAFAAFDAVGDGEDGQDCHGHGTHVAGTVGGATYGVARLASLAAVRVLDCQGSGSTAGVVAGFDWVAANAQQPAVLNASLGGSRSSVVDEAANAVADRGVLPVVAAGNETRDACTVSPARAARAFAVGATDRQDRQARFSNFGSCLELYGPGVDVVSARLGGGSTSLNGTSMASPHVAGVAALFKERHRAATSQEVGDWLVGSATANVLTALGPASPNRLLNTGGL